MKKDMLPILNITSSSQLEVTCVEIATIPSCCLKVLSVHSESETSHAANDITWGVNKRVFWKAVRKRDLNPISRSTPMVSPLIISQAFAVARSRTHIKKRSSVLEVPLSLRSMTKREQQVHIFGASA